MGAYHYFVRVGVNVNALSRWAEIYGYSAKNILAFYKRRKAYNYTPADALYDFCKLRGYPHLDRNLMEDLAEPPENYALRHKEPPAPKVVYKKEEVKQFFETVYTVTYFKRVSSHSGTYITAKGVDGQRLADLKSDCSVRVEEVTSWRRKLV